MTALDPQQALRRVLQLAAQRGESVPRLLPIKQVAKSRHFFDPDTEVELVSPWQRDSLADTDFRQWHSCGQLISASIRRS
jgi:hypothetical protein